VDGNRGLVGWAFSTSGQTIPANTPTDLQGCTVTFNALKNRFYRVMAYLPRLVMGPAETRFLIRDGSNAVRAQNTVNQNAGAVGAYDLFIMTIQTFTVDTPGMTYKASVQCGAQGDTTAGFLGQIHVEDLGAVTGAPGLRHSPPEWEALSDEAADEAADEAGDDE
jgi:hypothetical protein